MPATSRSQKAVAIALLTIGVSLNAIGVTLRSLGWFRIVIMLLGIALLGMALFLLVRLTRATVAEQG